MDRESLVYEARLAEQAERFEEMVEHMKAVIQSNGGSTELNPDERNLLSVAYKNVIGSRRRAWRVLLALESKHASIPDKKDLIATYKETIETELSTICADINTIIENVLIPGSTNDEAKVFYFKMAGDYYRYQAEYTMDTVREQNKADAEKAYAAFLTFKDVVKKNQVSTAGASASAVSGDKIGDAAKKLSDASYPFLKDVDWTSDLFLKPLPGASASQSLKAVDKAIVMGSAMDGNLLKAAAEAHHKAIGSVDAKGVTSAADYEAVNAALGRVIASVPTSKVMDVYNAFASIVNPAVPNKLFSTVNPLDAQAAAKAFYEFKDVVKAAR